MKFNKLILVVILVFLIGGCNSNNNEKSPMYITPVIEGANLSEEALNHNPPFKSADEAIKWSIDNGYSGASLLKKTLENLEPSGPNGSVQIGYQLGIPLLSLFEKVDGKWEINDLKVKSYLDLITEVERPVVVYLMANHFDTSGPLSAELAQDIDNLMLLKNGLAPSDDYFGNSVIPFTLVTDESIPVNHYRFKALRYISEKISELPRNAQNRIIGITMAGEVHHMFPDFANGTGEYENILVTDYSPKSINEFQKWLEKKYGSIKELNNNIGSNFLSFTEITPPSQNIHKEKLNEFTEHYDAYASGNLPISGWIWDPDSKIDKLFLYIDDEQIDEIKNRDLNRLDVYRALEEVSTPNVGFRYDLNYHSLKVGHHQVKIVAESKGDLFLISRTEIVVVDREQRESYPLVESNIKFRSPEELKTLQYWLDLPTQQTALYYNPLAKEWDEFRSYQVKNFLNHFFEVAKEAGLPDDKLYSHQIYSKINSSWNPNLFMEEESLSIDQPYNIGINLYGGATNSESVQKLLQDVEYGVPEYHIQQWKSSDVAIKSLEKHYNDGARFISPYYISIIPSTLKPKEEDTLQKFHINLENELEGSNELYKAIVEFGSN